VDLGLASFPPASAPPCSRRPAPIATALLRDQAFQPGVLNKPHSADMPRARWPGGRLGELAAPLAPTTSCVSTAAPCSSSSSRRTTALSPSRRSRAVARAVRAAQRHRPVYPGTKLRLVSAVKSRRC
jgi:hypothetical protein